MDREKEDQAACPFCRLLAAGQAVATQGTMAALLDGYPVTEGHLLIVPRRHVADGLQLSAAELADSQQLVRLLVDRTRAADPTVSGFNMGINLGVSAGQTVMHAHIHLIPRRDGDTLDPRGGVRGVIPGKRGY